MMSNGAKIAIVALVIIVGGVITYKWFKSREPKIEFVGTPTQGETVFKMSYKGMKHEGKVAYGQIDKKAINGYSFEVVPLAAVNNGNSVASKKMLFAIKDPTQKVVIEKTITLA